MAPRRILGFLMVILSAFPMGIGDSLMMDGQWLKATLITVFGFSIYWAGFSLAPKDLAVIIGIWEISAVAVAFVAYFGLRGAFGLVLTHEFFWNFLGMLFGAGLLVFFSGRLFGLLH